MKPALIASLGDELYTALTAGRTVAPLTQRHGEFGIDEAYRVSLHALGRREADGETVIGKKIGVTSKAVQEMLDVHQPDFGFLTDRMRYPASSRVSLAQARLIQPRAEGEIAFMLKADLEGPGITREEVLAATDWVSPCFEIVDSRIEDWRIRIEDTVADNASCGIFVVGEARRSPRELDLAGVQMEVWCNGEPAGRGTGAAVQGHPAEAVAWLANTLGRYGIPLRAGEVILSGALAPLVPVAAGDRFHLHIAGLGDCDISFA